VRAQFSPKNELERQQVIRLTELLWNLERARLLETAVLSISNTGAATQCFHGLLLTSVNVTQSCLYLKDTSKSYELVTFLSSSRELMPKKTELGERFVGMLMI